MPDRMGFTAPLLAHSVRDSCEVARVAEDKGYTDCWSAETSGPDGFSVASAIGIATTSIRTGIAVAPVYTRPPALMAMSALAAHEASAGRFCLGLGCSSPVIVEGWMGQKFENPVGRVRETVEAVRSAVAGEKVNRPDDAVPTRGFKLDPTPASPLPIYIAALGPKMLSLAAELADGVALYLASEEGVRIARRAVGDKEIVERILCCPDEPEDEVRAFMRWLIAPYLAVPAYNRYLAAQGFEDEAAALAKLWADGDRAGARDTLPDRVIDALVIMGPAGACKERIQSFRDAGLDTPIMMFVSTGGRDAVTRAFEAMAP